MSINYSFFDSLQLFMDSLRYDVMLSIIAGAILLCFVCLFNKKLSKVIIVIVSIILIFLIGKYYAKDILSFKFSNPLNNIYFYFFNSIIFIIVFMIESIKEKLYKFDYFFYLIFLIFTMFSIFMTNYLNNITEIVIYNIYPMIKLGNILILIYYLVVLTKVIYHVIIKSTSKRSEKN